MDGLVVVLTLVVMLPQAALVGATGMGTSALVLCIALVVVMAAMAAIRRRVPVWAFAGVVATNVVITIVDAPIVVLPLLLIISVAVWGAPRVGWICAGAAIVVLPVASAIAWHGDPTRNVPSVLLVLFGATIGSTLGARRRYLQALIELAKGLALERDQRAQIATGAERARIAREMHDIVAHGLSVMIRLADGADAIADTDPERSRAAVRQVAEVGRSSLADMRRALGVLRDGSGTADPADLGPQPTLADIHELVDRYRSAGLPVELRRAGALDLSDALQVVVYRGVQEGLTNALRYATAPTRVLVDLRVDGQDVLLDVVDDGVGTDAGPTQGSERGLIGLRERAALFSGTVDAGRIAPHGWRTRMTLPGAAVRTGGTGDRS